ncbi:MAG: hypothetical protein AAF846_18075 [Chloroflexota bacterium]
MSEHAIHWIHNQPRNYQTVLFFGRPSSRLAQHLDNALNQRGGLSMTIHPNSKLVHASAPYDCYVIDADYFGEIGYIMNRILKANINARILIISDTYNWRDAVRAFDYGAIDVIRQPRNSTAITHILQTVKKQFLPRRRTDDMKVN